MRTLGMTEGILKLVSSRDAKGPGRPPPESPRPEGAPEGGASSPGSPKAIPPSLASIGEPAISGDGRVGPPSDGRIRPPDSRDSVTRPTRPSGNLRTLIEPSQGDAFLVVIYGTELGRRAPLHKGSFEIGRSGRADLSLEEDAVSRHHARITWSPEEGYVIHDMGSTNGVRVNEQRTARSMLRDGDLVKIGRTILKFMTGANVEAHYHDEVYRLMTVDGLTQCYNRRYFEEALERECNRARRHKRPLSLVLFDIDHFKQKNDAFGHVAGDSILRQIAAAIAPRLRREDIFARTGGEEFAVLLPEIAAQGANVTAEKIRRIVEEATLMVERDVVRITVSVGFASLDTVLPQPSALFKAADEALYRAKDAGRNCVRG
jgi:diguanylate cyclase (GGDEF)-like protein